MNAFDEMRNAITEAKQVMSAADTYAGTMAFMIMGRLRKSGVAGYILTALKKELRDFNMHTGQWKEL